MVAAYFNDFTPWKRHAAPCRRDASEGAGIGPMKYPTPEPNSFRDRIDAHQLASSIWEPRKEAGKVLLKTVRRDWFRNIRIAVGSVRSEGGNPCIEAVSRERLDIVSDNLRDFHGLAP